MAAKENVSGGSQNILFSETVRTIQLFKTLEEFGAPAPVSEEDPSEQPISCRPESLSDYRRRLATFSAANWFNKPLALSPIECARRGLVNCGIDTVLCELCNVETTWNMKLSESAASWLQDCHSLFCPWRCQEVRKADPAQLSDAEVVDGFQSRLRGLQAIVAVPMLTKSHAKKFPEDPVKALAAVGWEYAGDIGGQGRLEDHVQRIACTFCMRTVPVQSFSHQRVVKCSPVSYTTPASPRGSPGQLETLRSPATPADQRKRAAEAADILRKRRKSGVKAETESSETVAARIARSLGGLRASREVESKTSSTPPSPAKESKATPEMAAGKSTSSMQTPTLPDVKSTSDLLDGQSVENTGTQPPVVLQQVLPPRSGLWVPSRRLQESNENADVDFDPLYLHKWYCPMFSAPGDAWSPFASRAVELAMRGFKSEPIAVAAPERRGPLRTDSTVARAEELLRTLDSVLPSVNSSAKSMSG